MQINIEKRAVLAILGVIFLLAGTLVYAYGTSNPSAFGHTLGEIGRPTATWYNWEGNGDQGQTANHDYCFLTRVYSHDDDHNSRTQGCYIDPASSNFNGPQKWTMTVVGNGGASYCSAICFNW